MPAVVTIHKFCSILFISTKSQELPQGGLYCKDPTITLGKYLKWPPMSKCFGKSRKENLPLKEETFGRPRFRKGDWTKTHRGEDRLITTNE